jgi:Zn-dependent protease
MQGLISIFSIAVLIISVVLHEMAHGYAALSQGDKTAWYAGRLTFNPLKHLDIWGSVIIPLILVVTNAGFIIGWAKPVPYNPNNLKNPIWGKVWVAVAGVLTNLAVALIFGLLIRFGSFSGITLELFQIVVLINIILAVFNLVPIPPLDGSKIILAFLPEKYQSLVYYYERYSFFLIILFVFYGWVFILPIVYSLFGLFTGIS